MSLPYTRAIVSARDVAVLRTSTTTNIGLDSFRKRLS